MGMPASARYYTAEMVRALPDDGNRYETVHGELLVSPSPCALHQLVLGRLYRTLGDYLDAQRIGGLFFSPADISWGPDTLVQPDLFVVRYDEARTLEWARMQRLLLAIEVLSLGSTRADRFTKRRLYQEQKIPAFWIVDADQRQVEVWAPDAIFPVVEQERLRWQPTGAGQACAIELMELFRPL